MRGMRVWFRSGRLHSHRRATVEARYTWEGGGRKREKQLCGKYLKEMMCCCCTGGNLE